MSLYSLNNLPQKQGNVLHELWVGDEDAEVKVDGGGDPALEGELAELDRGDGLQLEQDGFHDG